MKTIKELVLLVLCYTIAFVVISCSNVDDKIDKVIVKIEPIVKEGQVWVYPHDEENPFDQRYYYKNTIIKISNGYVLYNQKHLVIERESIESETIRRFLVYSKLIGSNNQ